MEMKTNMEWFTRHERDPESKGAGPHNEEEDEGRGAQSAPLGQLAIERISAERTRIGEVVELVVSCERGKAHRAVAYPPLSGAILEHCVVGTVLEYEGYVDHEGRVVLARAWPMVPRARRWPR